MQLNISPFKTVTEALAWAKSEIDEAAGAARSRYLTVTPGQDATYSAKYADAKAFVLAGYPEEQINNYPWVKAEAVAIESTTKQAADGIKYVGDAWNMQLGPAIEGTRIGGKDDLKTLTTIAAVVFSARQTIATLDKI